MMTKKRSAEKTVRDIRRATRRHYSAEEKIRIVLGPRKALITFPTPHFPVISKSRFMWDGGYF